MRSWLIVAVAVAAFMLLPLCAVSETAPDITALASFCVSNRTEDISALTDRNYSTYWAAKNLGYLEVSLPQNSPCFGIYASFNSKTADFCITAPDENNQWQVVYETDEHYFNQYMPLDGLTRFRLQSLSEDKNCHMSVSEITLLGNGQVPPFVQQWRMCSEKTDLMVLVAHADDELVYMGGMLPLYAGEMKKSVIVVYLANMKNYRANELLDGLWTCGVRYYPVFGDFPDFRTGSLNAQYRIWNQEKVIWTVTRYIRQYKPDVIVTHDLHGEYGHGAHRVTANAAIECIHRAADPGCNRASYERFGVWQTKKLYLHLYPEHVIDMDWRIPLNAFGGKTAFDVVQSAFECHVSQQGKEYQVEDFGDYDNSLFGLYFSTVGEDTLCNDFFENIADAP